MTDMPAIGQKQIGQSSFGGGSLNRSLSDATESMGMVIAGLLFDATDMDMM